MSASHHPELQRADPGSVLIVDDTEEMAALYAALLEAEGFRVRTAQSGKRALELLESYVPDLVVLDAMMPEMSGHEFLDRVRKGALTAGVPVVFLTASGNDEEAISRAFSLGANDYLVKPINRRILVERVRSLIAQVREKALVRAAARQHDEHGRLLAEVGRAKSVQRAQLPSMPTTAGKYRIVAALRPCHDVGGDVFDVIRSSDGGATVAVVDVSGHGLPAAMIATAVREMLRMLVQTMSPQEAMLALNHQLCGAEHDHYACVALVQIQSDVLHIVNAGLPPIVVFGDGGTRAIAAGGVPPGLVAGLAYESHTIPVSEARRVVVATDGVTEPFGAADRTDLLVEQMQLHDTRNLSAQELDDRMRQLFERHGMEQPDDATVLVLDCLT